MTIRVKGVEVEVSGESAEEVLTVGWNMIDNLLNRSHSDMTGSTIKITQDNQIDRTITEPPADSLSRGTSVFISHSSRDVKWIETELIPLLKEAGVAPWYSKADIRTADYWERQILGALNSCEWFLIVLSQNSATSEWVKDELHWAIEHRKNRIIPILIEQCDLLGFHIRLSRIEFVDWLANRVNARQKIFDLVRRDMPKRAENLPQKIQRRYWWEFWK
jgi:hypothetical protein